MGTDALDALLERLRLEQRARSLERVIAVLHVRAGEHVRRREVVAQPVEAAIADFSGELTTIRERLTRAGVSQPGGVTTWREAVEDQHGPGRDQPVARESMHRWPPINRLTSSSRASR